MPHSKYPEGLDELALQAAISSEIQSEWFMGDYKVGAECFARALLDALAERGYVLVDAKKQEPVAYIAGYYKDVINGETDAIPLGAEVSFVNMNWRDQIPLYTHPAIPRQVALPDVVEAIDLLKTWKTWLGPRRTACDDPKLWDRIDAACAKLATPPTQPSGEGGLK